MHNLCNENWPHANLHVTTENEKNMNIYIFIISIKVNPLCFAVLCRFAVVIFVSYDNAVVFASITALISSIVTTCTLVLG